jgi:hypothetical protein
MEIHYGAGRAAGAEQVTVTPSVEGNARIAKQRSKIENEDDDENDWRYTALNTYLKICDRCRLELA